MLNRLRLLWHTFEYLYYLRFAIVLWLALPAVAFIDPENSPSALLHAIFTPEYPGQFLGCVFFAVSCSMVAILLARIVCINGAERFPRPGREVPEWLRAWLGDGPIDYADAHQRAYGDNRALKVLLVSQMPNVYLIYRLIRNAHDGGIRVDDKFYFDIWMMLAGLILAGGFWWFVSALYYWSYPYDTFNRPARTLLYPRWCFGMRRGDVDSIERCGRLEGLLGAALRLIFSLIPRLSYAGYTDEPQAGTPRPQLWEAHRLAVVGVIGYLGLYIFLFPVTAPLKQPIGNSIALGGALVLFLLLAQSFLAVTIQADSPQSERWRSIMVGIVASVALLLLFLLVRSFFSVSHTPEPHLSELWFRPPLQFFPVLASVAVLITFVCFGLAAAAFFLDRFSFPVLTSTIGLICLLHIVFPHGGDHYYAARRSNRPNLITPSRLIQERCPDPSKPCSLIILTATGGGMHAAVWSSSIFVELEKALANPALNRRPEIAGFHQNLVFASTVSGGSIGFAPILREYLATDRDGKPKPFDTTEYPFPTSSSSEKFPLYQLRVRRATSCSALEAVAWGLEYSDFLHLVLPFLPPTRKYDRSVSLEAASVRNYNEPKCGPGLPVANPDHEVTLDDPSNLDHLSLGADDLRPSESIPAFTFNTTEVETGGRFLLANYANPAQIVEGVYPSESFLQLYPANIGLVTAARLSATYPYVSSAARIDPDTYCDLAAHFVDGGYYDNDGVASLVEFLTAAFMRDLPSSSNVPGADLGDSSQLTLPLPRSDHRIRMLLVEIRDSYDLDSSKNPESECTSNENCKPWGTAQQAAAPLDTFWRTGHVSISRRNRRELSILKDALSQYVDIEEVVFPFEGNPPLNWHLTPGQISDIDKKLNDKSIIDKKKQVTDWAQR